MLVGIVGGGQLAMMLAESGQKLGYRFCFLLNEKEDDTCVRDLGKVLRKQPGESPADLYYRLGQPDVVTVEKEAVDTDLLREFKKLCPVHPDPEIVHVCQHRGREKQHLTSIGVPTAPFREVRSPDELANALDELGTAAIIKACEQGYDGNNQWSIRSKDEIAQLFPQPENFPSAVVESRIDFDFEVSLIIARNRRGEETRFPATENLHQDGILYTSVAPAARLKAQHMKQLSEIADRLIANWNYCGVLAIECFVAGDEVLVNELAPRVHNSGHWTQLGTNLCQFEAHLRGIGWWPLPRITTKPATAMVNIIGRTPPEPLSKLQNADLHVYNKSPREGRKMGHVNIVSSSRRQLIKRATKILKLAYANDTDESTQKRRCKQKGTERLKKYFASFAAS